MTREGLVLAALFVVACADDPAPAIDTVVVTAATGSVGVEGSAPGPSSAQAPRPADEKLDGELPAMKAGPIPSSAPDAERAAAVLDLLAGGDPASRLPIVATDEGKPFDKDLRNVVAPSTKPSLVRLSGVKASEGLPPEVIQRIVRQNFGRFRLCYDEERKKDPALKGKVETKFTITPSGDQRDAATTQTGLNAAVATCVNKTYAGLTFPKPEGGKSVSVTVPITFAPE